MSTVHLVSSNLSPTHRLLPSPHLTLQCVNSMKRPSIRPSAHPSPSVPQHLQTVSFLRILLSPNLPFAYLLTQQFVHRTRQKSQSQPELLLARPALEPALLRSTNNCKSIRSPCLIFFFPVGATAIDLCCVILLVLGFNAEHQVWWVLEADCINIYIMLR
jgi:hypothetical protein